MRKVEVWRVDGERVEDLDLVGIKEARD